MSEIHDFRDLTVWQRAVQLAKEVYRVSRGFPRDEKFGLTLQVRRAAVSVSSNIAEGHARQGKEFAHFLSIAWGSVSEVHSQLLVGVELGFVSRAEIVTAEGLVEETRKMIVSLLRKLE